MPTTQPHLPLYYVILDAWTKLFGISALSGRLLSALFGIAALPLVYLVGVRLVDSSAALLATALFALSRYQIYYAQEVRMYSLVVLLTLLSWYYFLRLAEGRRMQAAYALSTVLLIYSHPFGVLGFLAQVTAAAIGFALDRVGYPLNPKVWPPFRSWLPPTGAVALACVPMGIALLLRVSGGTQFPYIPLPGPLSVAMVIVRYFGQWPSYAALVALLLVASLGLAALAADDRTVLLGTWAAVPIAVPFVASYLVLPVFWHRYTIVASPAFYLLVAFGVVKLGDAVARTSRRLRPDAGANPGRLPNVVRYALVAALVVALLASTGAYHATEQREQWDEAMAAVDERAGEGALVLVDDCMTKRGPDYYTTRSDLVIGGVVAPDSGTNRETTPTETVRELAAGYEEVWFVFSHVTPEERQRMIDVAEERHEPVWHAEYQGIEVVQYRATGEPTDTDATVDDLGCRAEFPRDAEA